MKKLSEKLQAWTIQDAFTKTTYIPEKVARVVLFLASGGFFYVTGASPPREEGSLS